MLEALGVYRGTVDRRSREEIESEVVDELENHIALATEKLMASGVEPAEAERQARRRFGNFDRTRRACLNIKLGERNMLRKMHGVLTLLLVALVGMLWYSNVAERRRGQDLRMTLLAEVEQALAVYEQEPLQPVDVLVLRVGDTLEIIDEYNPDRRTIERVGRDGQVLIPDVGWLKLAGKTREEAEQLVTEASRPYYVSSRVRLKVDP